MSPLIRLSLMAKNVKTPVPTQASFPVPVGLGHEIEKVRLKDGPEVPKRAAFYRKLLWLGLDVMKAQQAQGAKS